MNSPHLDPDLDARSRRVADRLTHRAGSIDLGPPMVEVVVARGRQRRTRRRAAVGIATAAGVCTASIVAVGVLSRPSDEGSITAAPTGGDQSGSSAPVDTTITSEMGESTTSLAPIGTIPVADSAVPLELSPSPFVWNRVDVGESEAVSLFWGGADHAVAGDGPFVAWSTAPGRTDDYRPTLWRSDDGQRWQQVETDPAFVARNIAERDGTFFTYGTSPATAAERKSDLSIGTSTDGGLTWQRSVLPLDTTDLAQEPGVRGVGVSATSMATSAAGVLLSAQVNAIVDLDTILPEEYRNSVWNLTDTGIEVPVSAACQPTATTMVVGGAVSTVAAGTPTAAAACESEVLTWAELGISERAAAAVMHPELQLFFSADGTSFQQIEAPTGFGADWTNARLSSFGEGFAALVNDSSGITRLLSSPDGRSWTDLGEVPIGYPESIDEWGGRLVLSGWGGNGNRQYLAVRDTTGTWTTTDLRSFLQPGDGVLPTLGASHLSVGPTGITVIGWLIADPIAELGGVTVPLYGGVTLQVADTSLSHVVYGPDGAVLAKVTYDESSDPALVTPVQDDTYGVRWEVHTEAGGPVVASYSFDDINQAVTDAGAYDGSPWTELLVLHSSDGLSWSRESLDELVGAKVTSSGGIRVSGNQVIVAANLADDRNPDGTPKQVLMIGTLSS